MRTHCLARIDVVAVRGVQLFDLDVVHCSERRSRISVLRANADERHNT
jgi:hypothetical protein